MGLADPRKVAGDYCKFLAFFRMIHSHHYCENCLCPLEQCSLLKIFSGSLTLFQHLSKLVLILYIYIGFGP